MPSDREPVQDTSTPSEGTDTREALERVCAERGWLLRVEPRPPVGSAPAVLGVTIGCAELTAIGDTEDEASQRIGAALSALAASPSQDRDALIAEVLRARVLLAEGDTEAAERVLGAIGPAAAPSHEDTGATARGILSRGGFTTEQIVAWWRTPAHALDDETPQGLLYEGGRSEEILAQARATVSPSTPSPAKERS